MLAAGCAVGLGNVWRFPFIVGQNGGAAFVLVYLAFLALLGFPLLVCELAIGRAARSGIASAMPRLAASGSRRSAKLWRYAGIAIFAGNVVLMMYYTDVCGWLMRYTIDFLRGAHPAAGCGGERFTQVSTSVPSATCYMASAVVLATATCAAGVQKGVERVTKWMMLALLALLGLLAVRSLSLPGAKEGLRFYLAPDWGKFMAHPWKSVYDAMGQAFFTLSLGVGCMSIFGSYMEEKRTLATEAVWIIGIDTAVAILSGVIIFPACATFGVPYEQGPGLIFVALPEIFAQLAAPRLWGGVFFLFLSLAALTTVVSVFECIIGNFIDETRKSRRIVAMCTGAMIFALSMPCILITHLPEDFCFASVLDMEDFVVSKLWLPIGSLAMCIFATSHLGWGWERFAETANTGTGIRLGRIARFAMRYLLPLAVAIILVTSFGS